MIALADSGILIRYFQPADAAYIGIHATLSRLQSSGDELVIALQNVAEFWNVCTRPKTARGGLGLSIPKPVDGYRSQRNASRFSPNTPVRMRSGAASSSITKSPGDKSTMLAWPR